MLACEQCFERELFAGHDAGTHRVVCGLPVARHCRCKEAIKRFNAEELSAFLNFDVADVRSVLEAGDLEALAGSVVAVLGAERHEELCAQVQALLPP